MNAPAQLQLLPDREPQKVFSGPGRHLALTWHNPSTNSATLALRTRLFQASSATAIPLGDSPWKHLQLLPGQTVLESATLDFPAVRAETRFVLQWVAGTNQVLGTTDVRVFPTNLLSELKTLTGDEPLGLLDPADQLKPLLKALAIDFADLQDAKLEHYRGKLVLAGPFLHQERNGLATQLQALAKKGTGIVWIQPPPEPKPPASQPLKPSFYTVPEGKGAVVVVQPELVAQLSESPQAQLNLLQFARQALHPEPLSLPHRSP